MNIFCRVSTVALLAVLTSSVLLSCPAAAGAARTEEVPSSLVQVFVQSNPVDLASPWQRLGVESSGGSGVIIDGQRILTAAHVVTDHVSVEVKREGMTKRYVADVEFIGHECDLALLTVDDETFFENVTAMKLGNTPALQDKVSVFGYPVGGDAVSVTEGIVSRVEVSYYSHSIRNLLLAQIDAAVNLGNSGGPVVADGSLVGIAVQTIDEAENVGYMVPASIVRHFLDDVKDGTFDGFPELGVNVQPIQNDALRRMVKMEENQTGLLVREVLYGGSLFDVVDVGDVLLEIDGQVIAEDLTIPFEDGKRVNFLYAPQTKQIGQSMSLVILRDGKRQEKKVQLRTTPFLVPRPQYSRTPQYYIFGGLVFQPLTMEYLGLFDDAPEDLTFYSFYKNKASEDRKQVIVINKVLAAPLNRGYQDMSDLIVESVNGKMPRDMEDLIHIIESTEGQFVAIKTESGEFIVLDNEQAQKDNAKILELHGVLADRNMDGK